MADLCPGAYGILEPRDGTPQRAELEIACLRAWG